MSEPNFLRSLFSQRVATYEVRHGAVINALLPDEEQYVARAVEKRQVEFRRGRHCARAALAQLGAAQRAIHSRPDRSPQWPAGYIGSITHTGNVARGYAAAAAARSHEVAGLGLDAEAWTPLEPSIQHQVLTASEQLMLAHHPEQERGLLAKLCFSAKEALYKCQYPHTETFLGFHDVELELDLEGERFVGRLLKASASLETGYEFQGGFSIREDLVLCAIEHSEW